MNFILFQCLILMCTMNVLVLGAQQPVYIEQESGGCTDKGAGWGYITTAAACRVGAVAVGWMDNKPFSWMDNNLYSSPYATRGCLLTTKHVIQHQVIQSTTVLNFNTDESSTVSCESHVKCLCTLLCQPGTYQDQTGQMSCKTCTANTYSVAEASSCDYNATSCPVGTYANGTAACESCPVGKYNNQTGSTPESTCKDCGTGTYQNQTGQTSCKTCELETYQDQAEQINCKKCYAGSYITPNKSACLVCEKGQWQNQDGQSSCKDCTAGQYNNATGSMTANDCKVCSTGTYSDQAGQSSCTDCTAGQYNEQTGQDKCVDCGTGQYNDQTGQALCVECGTGQYNDQTGKHECQPCLTPGYQNEEGQKDCKKCIAGLFRNSSTSCANCQTGKHQNEPAKDVCKECPSGYKSDALGLAQCLQCGNGQYTDVKGQPACKKCPWRGACQHLTTIHPKTRIGVAGPWYDRKPFVGTRLTLTNMIENGQNAVQTNKRLYDRDDNIRIGDNERFLILTLQYIPESKLLHEILRHKLCPIATTKEISETECRDIHWSTGSPKVTDVETIRQQVSSRNIFLKASECPLENKIYDEETCRLGGGTTGYAITNMDFYNPYNRLFYKCEQFADNQITEPGPYKNEPGPYKNESRGADLAQQLVYECNRGRTDPTSVCNIGTYWDKTACNWGKKLRVYVLWEYFISQTPCETPIQSASECVTAFDALSPQLNSEHSKVNIGCTNTCNLPGPQFPPACYIHSDKQWFYNDDHSSTNCINGCVCKKKSEKFRLIKSGVECNSNSVLLGSVSTLAECADKCRLKVDCNFFIYGNWIDDTGSNSRRCYEEKTNSAVCTEGFKPNSYDFYQLLSDGVMHKCYDGQKEVCRKKQFYKSANYYRSENICQNKVDSFNDCQDAADELGLVFGSELVDNAVPNGCIMHEDGHVTHNVDDSTSERTAKDFCTYKTGKECICKSEGLDRQRCSNATGLQLADLTNISHYGTYYRSVDICSPSDSFDNAQECKVAAEWINQNRPTYTGLKDIVVNTTTDTVADFSGYEVRTRWCNPITKEKCGVAAAQMGTYLSDYWQRETTNVFDGKYYPRGCYQKNDGVVFYNDGLEGGLEACTSDTTIGCVCETGFLKLPSISKPIGCFQEGTNFYWNNPNAVGLVEYKVKTSGKCTDDAGYGYITDLAKCMTAAKQLELSTASETVATIANNNGSPTGCLFYNNWGSERRPQLNNGASEPCGSNGYHCLCKRIPIHTLTCGEGGCVCKRNDLPKGCSTYNNKAYWSDNSNDNPANYYRKVDIIPESNFIIDVDFNSENRGLLEITTRELCVELAGIITPNCESIATDIIVHRGTTWTADSFYDAQWYAITSSADGSKLAAVVILGNIWTSKDSGTTWTEDTSVGSTKWWHAITSSADGTKLAAVVYNGNIWTSKDSGTTWTEDASVGSPKKWLAITSSADGTKLAAVVYNGNIWTSVNSGTTWTEGTSVGSTKEWYAITSSANGTKLAAGAGVGNIWTSVNSGTTWTEDTSVNSLKQWYAITSSADGSKLAAVVHNGLIFTSVNSGTTWTSSLKHADGNELVAKEWRDITSSADGTKLAAVVHNGNIWTSKDSGTTWTERELEKFVCITSSDDGTKLAAVAAGHGKIWTSDSGATWTSTSTTITFPSSEWCAITSSADGSKLAVVVHNGTIFTSVNSGTTWTEDASVGFTKEWRDITSSADGSKLAAVVHNGNIWTSVNSGTTWTEDTSVGSTKEWLAITSSADGSKLTATDSNGTTWTSTLSPCSLGEVVCRTRLQGCFITGLPTLPSSTSSFLSFSTSSFLSFSALLQPNQANNKSFKFRFGSWDGKYTTSRMCLAK